MIEKAEHERSIDRKQQKIKKLLADVKTLYQTCEEEEAKDELIGRVNEENWEPEAKAFELWSSAENVEEMQGIIVALKRKRAAVSAECSDVLSKLKDLKKTT
ncbi:Hypothetical predicted protein [Paramuricea clavata]|uniref:Uncharacterized protein n=1 Tax=Paramuricea clavata TaxID=317549 RepID=A0A6S7LT44_PARCT|nr:Hypothetical predicted protein [Paramuricea clavata]